MSYRGPGIYRHYKGGYYRVIGIAKHEITGQQFVIYHSYSIEHDLGRLMEGVDFVARPLNPSDGDDAFNAAIRPGPESQAPRFIRVKATT